jgi:polyisoprenoid-binding protein YceI
MKKSGIAFVLGSLVAGGALAEPVTYNVDPLHTYPAFEADHMGGMSIWRGKFNSSTGKIVYDKEAKSGTVEITVDAKSINFGYDKMNEHAISPDMLDVAKFPTAVFKGKLAKFNGDAPTEVQGELTLHGVTKPVTLKILSFLCKPNPMTKKETCGADALATINRDDFGVGYGKPMFKMEVTLRLTVEAIKAS